MKRWETAPTAVTPDRSAPDLETMIIKRSISRTRGSWTQIGPEVTDDGTE